MIIESIETTVISKIYVQIRKRENEIFSLGFNRLLGNNLYFAVVKIESLSKKDMTYLMNVTFSTWLPTNMGM